MAMVTPLLSAPSAEREEHIILRQYMKCFHIGQRLYLRLSREEQNIFWRIDINPFEGY